jgi:hypothetical protein
MLSCVNAVRVVCLLQVSVAYAVPGATNEHKYTTVRKTQVKSVILPSAYTLTLVTLYWLHYRPVSYSSRKHQHNFPLIFNLLTKYSVFSYGNSLSTSML